MTWRDTVEAPASASTVLLPLLLVALTASCATTTPPSSSSPPPPPDRTLAPPYCGDARAFRAHLLEDSSDAPRRLVLERWQPPGAGPLGAPIAEEDRPFIHDAARQYLRACGLAEAVALTRALVAFPTVSEEAPAPDHPAFGAMAQYLQAFARETGLGFSVYGAHDAWEVTLGEGVPLLGFVMHADVVPVRATPTSSATPSFSEPTLHPSDWASPPFAAAVREGRLYGRGTEDDKGPIAATLVVLRTLRMLGLVPRVQVLAIMGTAEENDWSGMKRYVAAKRPPLYTISVDAGFPVVIAEAGFVAWTLGIARKPADRVPSSVGPKIVDAAAGQFLTQVPAEATMDVVPATGQTVEALAALLEPIAARVVQERGAPFAASVSRQRDRVRVTARGASVHSSTADEGANPVWILGDIARELRPAPSATGKLLELVGTRLSGDHWGERLGVGYAHPMMGKLLVSPTLLKTDDDQVLLGINMRRPAGRTKEDFEASLDRALADLKSTIDLRIEELTPRYVGDAAIAELDGPLVPTLLDIWQRQTGQAARAISIRGGTYARLFPGAVSFGPAFPGHPYRGHAPDEYIELDALEHTTLMILEATLRLSDGARAP